MRKKIVIVLLVLLSCAGVLFIWRISTWHAVFLFSKKDLEWLAPYRKILNGLHLIVMVMWCFIHQQQEWIQ